MSSKKQKAQANAGGALQSVGAAIAAGHLAQAAVAASAVLPKLEEYAEREAAIIDKATTERRSIWIEVIRAYANDVPRLEKYPQMVRHAYAHRLGLNMTVSRKNWEPAQRKLYDSFCANQVSPLALMIELVGRKGAGAALTLLEGQGKLPEKVQAARVMLGKPARNKEPKQPTGEGSKADKADKASAKVSQTEILNNAAAAKKDAVDAVVSIISGTIPLAQLPKVVQACAAKLKGSADPLDKLLAEWLERDLTEYAKKADDDTGGLMAAEA